MADTAAGAKLTGLREIARVHRGDFRLTPNQNLIVANVEPSARQFIDALVVRHGLDAHVRTTPVHRDALACVALPTCSLAMAEAERYLPGFISRSSNGWRHAACATSRSCSGSRAARTVVHGRISRRSRLIGKAPGRYNLYLGGDGRGQRLNELYRENIDETAILAALDEVFARFAAERNAGERLGDFVRRVGIVEAAGRESGAVP